MSRSVSKLTFVLVCLTFLNFSRGKTSTPKYPVIIVPGDGGSQIEAKLNKTSGPHFFCEKYTSDFESLWLNLEEIAPDILDCFVDNMRLVYDRKTRTTHSPAGVKTRIPGFGETASVEYLDPSFLSHWAPGVAYFYYIVKGLVEAGFERGVSVRGAPYDFRKAPNELGGYYKQLKELIEDTYKLNNASKVVIVGHSLGNPTFLYFLNHQPQEWKDKYIHAFISLAGVWGGTVKPLRLMASGDGLGVYVVDPLRVRPEQRSMPSTAFLMPSDRFWNASEPFVFTAQRNYSVADYAQFFKDIGFMDGLYMRQDTEKLIYDLTAPGVPVHCMHGIHQPTPAGIRFPNGTFPDIYPEQINGNGDGTVCIRSLLGCLKWIKEQPQPIKHIPVKDVDHMSILGSPVTVEYVRDVATGKR